jgi:hypothetical protein
MTHRIRATFSPPARCLRAGVLPEQFERFCQVHEIAEQLRELMVLSQKVMQLDARVVIEIMAVTQIEPDSDLDDGDFTERFNRP